jgi:hypothetical protein
MKPLSHLTKCLKRFKIFQRFARFRWLTVLRATQTKRLQTSTSKVARKTVSAYHIFP